MWLQVSILEYLEERPKNIEIIDLPGFGLVWGSSRLYLFSGWADLKIALALVIYFEAEYADSELKEL